MPPRPILAVALLACTSASTLPSLAQQAPLRLIPIPREVSRKADLPVTAFEVVCTGCDADDSFAAKELSADLAARGVPAGAGGVRLVLERLATHPDPNFTEAMKPEGYTLRANGSELILTGATAAGVFYATQTVKQLFEVAPSGTVTLHTAEIRDWPAMQFRGLHDDLSRGPVDTLEFQKKLIRELAAYKANLYSPYFEHTQQYASNPLAAPPGGSISAADARELTAYGRHFHVTVIPEQEAFGHLRHVLAAEQYAPLAETPHGAVLSPTVPGSLDLISQWFTELASEYPGPFLHIGADETVDLGLGRTRTEVESKGLAQVYLDFVSQIDTRLRPLHRRILFWGDIAEHSPELLKTMPESFKQDTIAIPWEYNPSPRGFSKLIQPFRAAGFETWVAPGINNWSRMYPNNYLALNNIQEFTRDGQTAGATGQLNTLWYDDGEALASNNWYGILFGAAAAWQKGESSIPAFQTSYGEVFHGDMTGKIDEAQRELIQAHQILRDSAQVGDGSDGIFWLDPWSKDGMSYAGKLRPYLHDVRAHAERALTLIAEARAAYPPRTAAPRPQAYTPTDQLPSNPTSLREVDALDALELGARRFDFMALKFQMADEIAAGYARALAAAPSQDKHVRGSVSRELSDINGVNGRIQDIKDGYSTLRELYEQLWRRTNRPYALRPVLEHYDYTAGLWLARMDKVRSAQRQWSDTHTLPSASEVGIPVPPPGSNLAPVPTPSSSN